MENLLTYHLKNKAIRLNNVGVIANEKIEDYDIISEKPPGQILKRITDFYDGKQVEIRELNDLDWEKRLSLKNVELCGNPVFLFCKIICGRKTKIVMQINSAPNYKIWVNSNITAAPTYWYRPVIPVTLNKGENLFIVEIPDPSNDNSIGIRINKYTNEIKDDYKSLLCRNNTIPRFNANVAYNTQKMRDEGILEYMLLLNDTINVDPAQDVVVKIMQQSGRKEVDSFTAKFFKKYTLDIGALGNKNTGEPGNEPANLIFHFEYKTVSGELCSEWTDLFLYPEDESVESVVSQAKALLEENNLTEYDKLMLNYYLGLYNSLGTGMNQKFGYVRDFIDALNLIKNNEDTDQLIYKAGFRTKYYKSDIDDSIEKYYVFVPENYDKSRKYPLFITLSTARYSNDAHLVGRYTKEPVIAVDISGRGVTMGSYVAEAAIWEAIHDVKKTYNIDESRIYMTGMSNGAGATWAQVQAYPHEFAGIFPISGAIYELNACNVKNLRIINVSSAYENLYDKVYKKSLKCLRKIKGFTGVLADSMVHGDLNSIRCKEIYIDEMLKCKKDPYPNSISYRTERNRHRKAYWVEIDAISYGKKEAIISAEIHDNTIYINIQGAAGFTVTLPPQLNKEQFQVVINKVHKFDFSNYHDSKIHFTENSGRFAIDESTYACDYRKGMGLLDIFLKPMRIFVSDTGDKDLMKVAEAFSQPYTNGFDPKIYVQYPILDVTELGNNIQNVNAVLIDHNKNNTHLAKFRELCPIKMHETGYEYLTGKYAGSYSIMQIMANPFNAEYSILYINSNDKSMLKRNLFTRKVVVPSYSNGLHPYWNNEGLVFANEKYYGIYEWGMDMEEIK